MAYGFIQDVPIDDTTYARIAARLETPLTGLLVHLVVRRADGGLRYIDVWESEQACTEAFDNVIHPAVFGVFQEAGISPQVEPAKQDLELVEVRFAEGARP